MNMEKEAVNFTFLQQYHVSPTHGFLVENPLSFLPPYFAPWEELCRRLPELLEKHDLRPAVEQLPLLDHQKLAGYKQKILAHLMLTFLSHGYVWQDHEKGVDGIAKVLPECLAVPLYGVAQDLGIEPVLGHPSAGLANYAIIDESKPLSIDNMRSLYSMGGKKFDWFALMTTQAEIDQVQGLRGICYCKEGVSQDSQELVMKGLQMIKDSCKTTRANMPRFYEHTSPEDFFSLIKPFITGFGVAGSRLPEGLVFQGVSSEPLKLAGWVAAQSSTNLTLDALFGVIHDAENQGHLDKWKNHMPPDHREFIAAVRKINLKGWLMKKNDERLNSLVSDCLKALQEIRSYHIKLVVAYIITQERKDEEKKGESPKELPASGGQPMMPYLKSVRDSTVAN